MSKLQALTALRDKVKVGDMGSGRPLILMRIAFPSHDKVAWKAHNGSLDAAKALHEAVLPDESWMVRWVSKYPNLFGSCGGSHQAKVGWGEQHIAYNDNPARAWLLAILEALIAQEGTGNE